MLDNYDIAGVTFASAQRWLNGEIFAESTSDLDTSRNEVVFINEIGHADAIPAALAQIVALGKSGANGAIAHTCDPVMLDHLLSVGFVVAKNEQIIYRGRRLDAQRLVCSPDAFRAWMSKPSSIAIASRLRPSIF